MALDIRDPKSFTDKATCSRFNILWVIAFSPSWYSKCLCNGINCFFCFFHCTIGKLVSQSLDALWSASMNFGLPLSTLVSLGALWAASKHFGQPGCTCWFLISLDALWSASNKWSALMHFGQPLSSLVSLDALWSASTHFGQPLSTLFSMHALWSVFNSNLPVELWSASKHFVHPGCTSASLLELWFSL